MVSSQRIVLISCTLLLRFNLLIDLLRKDYRLNTDCIDRIRINWQDSLNNIVIKFDDAIIRTLLFY